MKVKNFRVTFLRPLIHLKFGVKSKGKDQVQKIDTDSLL